MNPGRYEKMPGKIERQEVCSRLLAYAYDNLDTRSFMEEGGTSVIRYNNFREAMMETDLIASEPTIRSKWKSLAASGIVRPQSRDGRTGVIDWSRLKFESKPALVARLESDFELESEKNKKTKKHTEEASA